MSRASADEVREFTLLHVADGLRARALSPDAVPDDFDLLLEGVIDSFGLLELITAVETRFELQLDFEDLDADDLTVIGPFSRYVAAKLARSPAS
jgi:acyl carrier protein